MKLVITQDGSHTIYVPEINEHYHSVYGAITESQHIFINYGLKAFTYSNEISILEIGFGTGLNALLTYLNALKMHLKINYYTLEKFPLPIEIINKLNYGSLLNEEINYQDIFLKIHDLPWNKTCEMNPEFSLHKIHGNLESYKPFFNYDLIYFDAFAPDKQPGLWNQEIFNKLFDNLNTGGIITTYCVKGEVKKMLTNAGFKIEKLPGPPGKREILRGIKTKQL